MKRIHKLAKIAILSALSAVVWTSPVFAENENPVSVMVDNEAITFDQPPVIQDGRTLVPIRAVFEKAGAAVTWDQDTQTATMKKGDYTVSVKLGESFILKNNTPVAIDVPSSIINDRILIPVRAISEAMDFSVSWNPVYRSVLIATDGKTIRPNAQWKTGFKSLKDFGFYVEASVSELKYDLNADENPETISFKIADETPASLTINGADFTSVMLEACKEPFAFGIVNVRNDDKFTEILVVDAGESTVTAHLYRYNGFELFELKPNREELSGIDFNENLFFDGIENIISDLDGLCFLDTMVCPGIYSIEDDSVVRYSLDYKKTIGMTFNTKYDDDMPFFIYYTDTFTPGAYLDGENIIPSITAAKLLPKTFTILDTYMDTANPSNFEFYVQFSDGSKAVIWPYRA